MRTIPINGKFIRGVIAPKFMDEETITPIVKSIEEVANEVLSGLWGDGTARKEALTVAGYNYEEVQKKVNEIIENQHKEKILHAACRTILGEYGTGVARRAKIESLGLSYEEVQKKVNMIIEISKE